MSAGELVEAAVAAERAAVVAYGKDYCREVRALAAKKRVTAAEADMLCRRVTAFAEGVGAGLHRGEVA